MQQYSNRVQILTYYSLNSTHYNYENLTYYRYGFVKIII